VDWERGRWPNVNQIPVSPVFAFLIQYGHSVKTTIRCPPNLQPTVACSDLSDNPKGYIIYVLDQHTPCFGTLMSNSAKEKLVDLIREKCISRPDESGHILNIDPIWADPSSLTLAADLVSEFLLNLKKAWDFDTIVVPIRVSRMFGVLPIAAAASVRALSAGTSIPIVVWKAFGSPISGEAITFPINFKPERPILFDAVIRRGRGITTIMIDLKKGKGFDILGVACVVNLNQGGLEYINGETAQMLGRHLKFDALIRIDGAKDVGSI